MEKLKELLYDIKKDPDNLGRIHGLIMQYANDTQAKAWTSSIAKSAKIAEASNRMISIHRQTDIKRCRDQTDKDTIIQLIDSIRDRSEFDKEYYSYNHKTHSGKQHISVPKTGIMFSFDMDGNLLYFQKSLKPFPKT